MKVILLERVGRYGTIGDEVTVKNGYARNFLLPEGKALRATEANRTRFQAERVVLEKRNEDRRDAAAGIASGLNGHSVVMIRQAGETGQLYGSVSSRDIAEALQADEFIVARSQVDLAAPIKTVGLHPVSLNLHAEVEVTVNINVARSEDEATRQAAGDDMMVVSYDEPEEEAAPESKDVFDDEDTVVASDDDDAEEGEEVETAAVKTGVDGEAPERETAPDSNGPKTTDLPPPSHNQT